MQVLSFMPRPRKHGAPIVLGLNLNGILTSLFGGMVTLISGVSVYLITNNLKDTRETRDIVISHTQAIKDIQTEQARLRRDYVPPVAKP